MASNSSTPSTSDLKDSRWYFTAEQLAQSPSRKHGINADQELFYRQQTADLIQKMGQKLQVSQLCINTAIVYMHRFYAFHSFTHFHRNGIATASLFLAAKVEEQPRKLEHVIKVAHLFLGSELPHSTTEVYNEQAQDLVFNENVLLQTLGFDVAIDHPHTHVVKTCHLVKACKDLAQTSYFLASNSLHLTPMCLQYRPTVVACFCIYLACKWSRWEIPQSTEGKHWFHYVDSTVTMDLLKQLTDEFLAIYEKSPARLTSKLNSIEKFAQGARMSESTIPISDSANGSSSQLSELQPARRPESYSSHHRRHSSSASSHHNHHSKQLPPNELGEHGKPPTSHKQPYTSSSGSHSNRPRPERAPITAEGQFNVPSHGSNKQSVPPSVPRPSNSNRPPHGMPAPVATNTTQRLPHAHDPNYHKNRSSIPPQVNPVVSGHKTLPKPGDPQRNVMKDATGRPIDPNKISNKHSSSSSSSSFPAANASATGIDMTRNVLQMQGSVSIPQQQQQQQQRPYTQSNSTQPPNYNQAISSRSSNNSSKYDQSVQQQMHLQSGQKQSLESSFSAANSRQIDDGNMKVEQMEMCSPPKYPFSQVPPASVQQIPPPTSQSKSSSIFSPEWNEKVSHSSIPNINMKTNNGSSSNSKFVGLTIKSNRDSPKKSDREKRSDTPKKDKNRSDQQLQDINKQYEKRGVSKKLDASGLSVNTQNIPIMPAYDVKTQQALNLSGMKRPNDGGNRIEDEREFKVRKVEPPSPPKMSDQRSYLFDQHSNDSRSMKSFPPTVNGIETDPDLVRNLLKESLCSESKFSSIKSEPLLDYVDMIKPIEPITDMETLPAQLLQYDSPKKEIKEEPVPLLGVEDFSKSKAEKKKKKDKHKHKEKDKSKDKEEKKKHKKDKDKHKERERSSGNELEQNHVKLTIPKEKLNLPMLDTNPPPSDLKIKIPKDRIRAELTNYQLDDIVNPIAPPQHNSLKIKISKDKIENYSHQQQTSSSHSIGNNYHSHSSKKKDRDRDKDREKEKKRSSSNSNEHNKQNGGGGGMSESSSSSSSTKNQSSNSNKMQHYSSNMSQLFGDINDDDLQQHPSHHQQQRYSHSEKYNMQYHQQQMNHK